MIGGCVMILTERKIRELVKTNELITPFLEEKLQSESYDVTIGKEVVTMKKEVYCLDISRQDSIDGIYQSIDISKTGYVVSPKEYILVSLVETIRLPDNITAHLRPKTRYTRLGLLVSGQHCNSSYEGHMSIGLFNATDYPIRIHSGYTIAQIVFEELDDVPSQEKLYRNKQTAHYQNENGTFRGAKFDDEYLDSLWDKILDEDE